MNRIERPSQWITTAVAAALTGIVTGEVAWSAVTGGPPKINNFKLPNGIRVVVLEVEGSSNVSLFTFLPMGLATDGPGQAQWSHLVEHLIIRSTIPFGSTQANAETLPNHMRLDFYGTVDTWREGLSHHARWLKGVPFTEESLVAEKPRAIAECEFVVANLATHKFAIAAWAQGFRHGRDHAAIKADLARATLAETQAYRDEHLAVLDRVVVCIIGGIDAKTAEPVIQEQLGAIQSRAAPVPATQVHASTREMTWDLNAQHVVFTWPIPSFDKPDYAAVAIAAQWLMIQCYQDAALQQLVGMIVVGADLAIPEGNFFYVSASLRPGASADNVRARVKGHLDRLRMGQVTPLEVSPIGFQLSYAFATLMDPSMLQAQAGRGVTPAMVEGQLGLTWGMHEYQFGSQRKRLAKQLSSTTVEQVRTAAQQHLDEAKCTVCTLRPL